MTGGLLQLVAYGAQDVYLTGNPQITFFKVVYRRHTNFAMESIQQTFNGTVGLGKRVTAQISRNGDLIHKMMVVMDLQVDHHDDTAIVANQKILTQSLGHYLLKRVELEIGGQLIDRQYSEWMYIWNELCLPIGKQTGFSSMTTSDFETTVGGTDKTETAKLYVPLEFWFCRNIGLALPLIALQYHEVKVNIEFASSVVANPQETGTLNETATFVFNSAELWVDYIFLDTDERRRFAQLSHEYLIEQIQFTGAEPSRGTTKLNFNHPMKTLIWFNRASGSTSENWTTFNSEMTAAKLQLNGNDRIAMRDAKYFTHVQPYQHYTNIPDDKNINVYSFALKPEEHQPSGTLNMSRIDTASLKMEGTFTGEIYVYGINYNVLRILSGMGGLAFSN
tara:strand:- start:18132 stop:19307 length:1176 start_codon:yes stop_codon:yes gene_type:complete